MVVRRRYRAGTTRSRRRANSRSCTRRRWPSTSRKAASRTRSACPRRRRTRYSHLAKVVLAGLQEYQFQHDAGGTLAREDLVDTVRRAIQRATALTANDLKKGIPSLATIGATAPFVGLLGTVVGIINAFHSIGVTGSGGLGAVSAGISEALVETALGLVVAIPAVWMYNYFTGRLEYFNVEMDNSSSELVDYFIKKTA